MGLSHITVYMCNILVQQGWYVLLNEQVDTHPNILTFYAKDEYVYEFVEADGDWDCWSRIANGIIK